jgi:hypothetical protein
LTEELRASLEAGPPDPSTFSTESRVFGQASHAGHIHPFQPNVRAAPDDLARFARPRKEFSGFPSRHLAERLSYEGKLNQVKALILVDMAADRHLNILRESSSTAWLSDLVFKTARTLGYGKSFSGGTFPVEDDHTPFLARGIPSVDIIDLTPFGSYHHTAQDSIDKCSPESLTVVGRVVLATLAELERKG